MKKTVLAVALLGLAACNQQASTGKQTAAETKLDSDAARYSYAIGLNLAKQLQGLGADFDRAAFTEALNTQLDGKQSRLSEQEAAEITQKITMKRMQEQLAERQAQSTKNKEAGEKFLAENAKKPGIHVTDSGLQYEVLTEGTGAKPKLTDHVKVNYRGTLLDGTEFDSSYKRGEPVTFGLNQVIRGWTEGLQLMPVGSKYRFFIPANLAYGEHGAGKRIGPNETLIFEVELLDIEQ